MRQLNTIAISQFLEFLWQLLRGWHLGATHQNRNNRDVALQGGSCFDANEIRGIVETARPAFVFRIEPSHADDYQKHTTFGDAFFNCFTEVASRLDGGYIHEYGVFAEGSDQIVKQTTSFSLRVTPPIADKNTAHFAFS